MAFLNDFTVDFTAKTIRHTAGTTIYLVNTMYSELQNLFDEPGQMDDLVPMSAQTPTEYSMVNGWFIDDKSTEFLRGGAITSSGWAGGVIRAISYITTAGFDFIENDIGRKITGSTTSHVGTIVHHDVRFGARTGVLWIRPDNAVTHVFNNSENFIINNDVITSAFTETVGTFADVTNNLNVPAGTVTLSNGLNDALYIGSSKQFTKAAINISTSGTGGTVVWEYWNGSVWSALNVVDGTINFTAAAGIIHDVTFDLPTDWILGGDINLGNFFYIRAKITVTFTAVPIVSQLWTSGRAKGNFTSTLKDNLGSPITASITGETIYGNPNVIGTIEPNTEVYVIQKNNNFPTDKINQFWNNTTHTSADTILDFVLKIQEFGVLIDGGRLNFLARQYTKNYDNFKTTQIVGKQFPIPLATANDLNNTRGDRQMALTAVTNTFNVGDLIRDDSDATIEGVVTSYDTSTTTLQYYLVNSLTDFSVNDTFAVVGGTGTGTAVNSAAVNVDNNPITTITITHAAINQDINDGGGAQPYSIKIDVANLPLLDMYERVKFLTRRGSVTAIDDQDGEQYLGNELRLPYSSQNTAFTEGFVVTGASGAKGTIVANHNAGLAGDLILRNVVGTFQLNEAITDGNGGSATAGTPVIIPVVKASPLGTFAGGKFFGAPGVFLINELPSEAKNFQLVDDNGVTRFPPNTISVEVNSLAVSDRVGVYSTITSGGTDINKAQYTMTIQAAAATTITVATPIDTNLAPKVGVVRIVKNPGLINESEQRYRYSSFTGSIFTLFSSNGTAASGTQTSLTVTGGPFTGTVVKIGDIIQNTSDSSSAIVTGITGSNDLTHTTLTGGTTNTWAATNAYTINHTDRDYDANDQAYTPIIEEVVESGTIATSTIVHSTNVNALIRVRQGKVILPFQTTNTITTNGLSVGAIRTLDNIAI